MQVRIHPRSAILTLVGDRVAGAPGVWARVRNALKPIPAMVLSAPQSDHAIVVVVGQSEMAQSAALLHREFFAQPDPSLFAPCYAGVADRRNGPVEKQSRALPHPPQKLRLVLELGR